MERFFNVHETLKILKDFDITDSIQMVSRWIRDGKIYAERSTNRKDGWLISEDCLYEFISQTKPGMVQVMEVYYDFVDNLPIRGKGKEADSNTMPKSTDDTNARLIKLENKMDDITKQLKQLLDRETSLIKIDKEITVSREKTSQPTSVTMTYDQFVGAIHKYKELKAYPDDQKRIAYDFFFNGDTVLKKEFLSEDGRFIWKEKSIDRAILNTFLRLATKKKLESITPPVASGGNKEVNKLKSIKGTLTEDGAVK